MLARSGDPCYDPNSNGQDSDRSGNACCVLIATAGGRSAGRLVAHQADVSASAHGDQPGHAGGGSHYESAWRSPCHGDNGAERRLDHAARNQESRRRALNFGWRSGRLQEIAFTAGKKKAPNLKEGKARLIVEAQSNDLRGATDTISADVDVILRPPSVTADGFQHYINQGGSEMVLLTPSGYWTEAGVRVGKNKYRSFPVAGQLRSGSRFLLIPGTCRSIPRRSFSPAIRRARKPRRISGSRFFRRNSATRDLADRRQVSRQGGQPDRSRRVRRSAQRGS